MSVRMLTLREVSVYLHVNPATVRNLVRRGELRAIRVGRDLRFEVRVVDQWVAEGGSIPWHPEQETNGNGNGNGSNGADRRAAKTAKI